SPDCSGILIGGRDRTAKVCEARTGAPLLELKGQTGWLDTASFAPDGSRMSTPPRPTLLLVGGGGGLVGRAVVEEFAGSYRILSVHRHHVPNEVAGKVEWFPADLGRTIDWTSLVQGTKVILTLAWYRWESEQRFRELRDGLLRLVDAARRADVPRLLHVSVPPAPADLEERLPYLRYKREVDAAIEATGLSYRILRPSMLFGHGDRLLGVLLRLIHRYGRLPMFGDGSYHVSPLAARDLAAALRLEAEGFSVGTVDAGGPVRYTYHDLTDLLFAALDRRPKYVKLRPQDSARLASLMSRLGSSLLYAYEVRWLVSDLLGLPPYEGLDRPLMRTETYLRREAARILSGDGR
ncbi:MAG: NAD(P)H-binding protein, partial [Thermoplasmata archaeon]|nr:NAD(P)H-binding protein [Thermoplasmata archaeon]